MTNDQILKQVIKGLGDIAEETGKETLKQSEEVFHSIITGKELVGNLQPVTDQEKTKLEMEDKKKKQEEMAKIRSQISGRPVEQEMEQIRKEEEQIEAQKKQQEQQPKQEEIYVTEMPTNHKKSAAKHQGMGGKKKSHQPDPTQLSQTAEKGNKLE